MRESTLRIGTYFLLAILAYGSAFAWGRGVGVGLLLVGGALAELAFWWAVLRRARRQ